IDHPKHTSPRRDSIEITECAFETTQNRECRQARGCIALFNRQLAADFSKRRRNRSVGSLWPVTGNQCATADKPYELKRQQHTGRRLDRRWQNQATRAQSFFYCRHRSLYSSPTPL